MKNKSIILMGILTIMILMSVIFSEDKEVKPLQSTMPEYSNPFLPNMDGPLPNGEKVSLDQANARVSYAIPLPKAMNIKETWVSVDTENKQSTAIQFDGDLLLIIHESKEPPNWNKIILGTPELVKISVNGNSGIGTNPGFTRHGDRKYPYPGSVEWWVNGLTITLYSDTMTLDELLKIANTIYSADVYFTPTEMQIPTATPTETPTQPVDSTDTPSPEPSETPTP